MAVYTEVPQDEAAALLRELQLGELTALRGIQGGIENTNYFATTVLDGVETEHVLTVFERLGFEQLRARRLEIRTDSRNAASRAVAERCGFTLEGVLRRDALDVEGQPCDSCVYGMTDLADLRQPAR